MLSFILEDEENDDDDEENPRNVALQLLDTIAIKLPNTEVLPVILNFATQAAQGNKTNFPNVNFYQLFRKCCPKKSRAFCSCRNLRRLRLSSY